MVGSETARLVLVRPTVEHRASYLDFIDEMRSLGETIWPSRAPILDETFSEFVARVLAKETVRRTEAVPETIYWALIDDDVVGAIALRHQLTEDLARYGGHIGYEVRPSWRRRGVATEMLRQTLATEHAQRIGRVLVTCSPSNLASRRAIEANGGVLNGIVFVENVGRETCHYWFHVTEPRP